MKQTMKSKAGSKCSISIEESVSSAKGTTRKFGLIRCTKTFLKLRFMNQHENDLFPGPLTVSGFNGCSCCTVKLPVTDQIPVKSDFKNQHRIKSNTGIGLSVPGYLVEDGFKSGKHKYTLKTHAEKRDFSYNEINLTGAPECVAATEFRRQSERLADYKGKTSNIALNAVIRGFTQFDEAECIYLGKIIQMQCEAVKTRFGMIGSTPGGKQNPDKNPLRLRKTMHSKRLFEHSNRWKHRGDCGIELYSRFSNN
jgi:hypothetical protein